VGANTRYYVKVGKMVEEWIEVSALTEEDAEQEAIQMPEVITVTDVKHWSYFEEIDGC
jgi:uncharacterized protein YqfB (UPF0267 family)